MKLLDAISLLLMAVLYATAGVMHFADPGFFLRIMPAWLPWHLELVQLSGAIEIALALLLLLPATRRIAAWGVIALLIAVFPANLNMLLNDIRPDTILGPTTRTALWLRLPVQFLLAAWAWRYTRAPRHDTGLRPGRLD